MNASPCIGSSHALSLGSSGASEDASRSLRHRAPEAKTAPAYVFEMKPWEWSRSVCCFTGACSSSFHLSDPTKMERKDRHAALGLKPTEVRGQPFSFVNCLRVVGSSPLSPVPYLGPIDAESIRDWIRHHIREWLSATIARYPSWAAEAVLENPCWIESRLAKNPQWINEEIKKHTVQGDLFA